MSLNSRLKENHIQIYDSMILTYRAIAVGDMQKAFVAHAESQRLSKISDTLLDYECLAALKDAFDSITAQEHPECTLGALEQYRIARDYDQLITCLEIGKQIGIKTIDALHPDTATVDVLYTDDLRYTREGAFVINVDE